VKREISDEVFCEHCGDYGPGIQYIVEDVHWCAYCVHADGVISVEDLNRDLEEENEIQKKFYLKKLKELE